MKREQILVTLNEEPLEKPDGSFYGQICQDSKTTKAFRKLHKDIIDKILKFCLKYNIDVDELFINADHLSDSIKFGEWQPGTDSSFEMYVKDKKDLESPFLWSI